MGGGWRLLREGRMFEEVVRMCVGGYLWRRVVGGVMVKSRLRVSFMAFFSQGLVWNCCVCVVSGELVSQFFSILAASWVFFLAFVHSIICLCFTRTKVGGGRERC